MRWVTRREREEEVEARWSFYRHLGLEVVCYTHDLFTM